eukprot:scaffold184562_cov31-Tisochrysis_lutea.AAC.3
MWPRGITSMSSTCGAPGRRSVGTFGDDAREATCAEPSRYRRRFPLPLALNECAESAPSVRVEWPTSLSVRLPRNSEETVRASERGLGGDSTGEEAHGVLGREEKPGR